MSDPLIGSELQGRYRVIRLLGEGGMGAVYEAENLTIGRKVAIKVLHAQFATNPQVVQRFHQEARAAAAIGHPNIIEVLDMGKLDDGASYMVLEYLEGKDWSDEIEESGPLPLSRVASILVQVCDALQAAHTAGIIHRDLKPENIFLIERHERDDFVKVLDFGISKVLPSDSEQRALTQTNMMLGTAYYMSPEQTRAAKHVDHRSDIFTLGVILFQALTGYYPFNDAALPMLFVKICTEEPKPLSDYRSDLPSQVESVFRKLIAKDVKKRYQSCAQVKAALLPFIDHDDAPAMVEGALDPKDQAASALTGSVPDEAPDAPVPAIASVANDALPVPKRNALLLALVVTVLGAGGAAAFGMGAGNESDEPTLTTAAPVQQPQPQPQPPEETPAGSMIMITVLTTPADAVITLDGNAASNPLTIEAPRDPSVHTLLVEAPGYVSRTERITYVQSREVSVELEAERGTRRGRTPRTMVAAETVPAANMLAGSTPAQPIAETAAMTEVTMTAPPVQPTMDEPTMDPTPVVSGMFRGI